MIKRDEAYDVGFVSITGSVGKKLSILEPDFDCVVFVNVDVSKFDKVLEKYENILKNSVIPMDGLRKTKHSLQFSIHGFNYDLLPATNFLIGQDFDNHDVIFRQRNITLRHIRKQLKRGKESPQRSAYSSGLAHSNVHFMTRYRGFSHEIARIARFWFKCLQLKVQPYGAKRLIEVVALHAAKKKKNHESAFRTFLGLMSKFNDLVINLHGVFPYPAAPYVSDLSNPLNNLAVNWDNDSITLVKKYALSTLSEMDQKSPTADAADFHFQKIVEELNDNLDPSIPYLEYKRDLKSLSFILI